LTVIDSRGKAAEYCARVCPYRSKYLKNMECYACPLRKKWLAENVEETASEKIYELGEPKF
jgi:hypothetical protein